MPDRHGFEHLGTELRCIKCGESRPMWEWSDDDRAQQVVPTYVIFVRWSDQGRQDFRATVERGKIVDALLASGGRW